LYPLLVFHEPMISGLQFWEDDEPRTASGQMAMDEALLRLARCPVVRFYRWATPALTFGYAQRYADVRASAGALPAIRRWTGGGMVFHGQDLTIALAVPASHDFCRVQTGMVYQRIHEALLGPVREIFPGARLAGPGDCRAGPACFVSPALNDILDGAKKICGGALRRGKAGLLYQGSLRGKFSVLPLARSLSASAEPFEPDGELLRDCVRLDVEKYRTPAWNEMR
jgi:lipoate-protein ligase A